MVLHDRRRRGRLVTTLELLPRGRGQAETALRVHPSSSRLTCAVPAARTRHRTAGAVTRSRFPRRRADVGSPEHTGTRHAAGRGILPLIQEIDMPSLNPYISFKN